MGPTLLLKTESGQFQLLRVGTAPAAGGGQAGVGGVVGQGGVVTASGGVQLTTNVTTGAGGNQTIRLQTMPAVSRFVTGGGGGAGGNGTTTTCQLQLRKTHPQTATIAQQQQKQQQEQLQQVKSLDRRPSWVVIRCLAVWLGGGWVYRK